MSMYVADRRSACRAWLLGLAILLVPCAARGGETELIERDTPWRVWLSWALMIVKDAAGQYVLRGEKGNPVLTVETARLDARPPAGWTSRDYDDSRWGRYTDDLFLFIGGYGADYDFRAGSIVIRPPISHGDPALLCLRTRFGIEDPARAADVTVSVEYLGGAVVYVNGKEVGRGHMPQGPIGPHTPALDYPAEAYVLEDGTTPLPPVRHHGEPDEQWLPRYRARVRRMTCTVPTSALVKGGNVLAIELHRGAMMKPEAFSRWAWSHVGVRSVNVTSAGGAGAVSYATALEEALAQGYAWNANATDTVGVTTNSTAMVKAKASLTNWDSCFREVDAVKGLNLGNPFDPVKPIRMVAARNGSCSGQLVLSHRDGVRQVLARLAGLRGPGGAALPDSSVRIRYAFPEEGSAYCNAFVDKPPEGATTLPVWVLVEVPKDQPPGWYAGTLTVSANGRQFAAPVEVLVAGCVLPDPKDYRSLVGLMQSPDTVAIHYGVEPWSDRHFQYLERSFELLGQLGNDILYLPVALDTCLGHRTGLVRWVKTQDGHRPEYAALEKYLDLYVKHCGPPKCLVMIVWEPEFQDDRLQIFEGKLRPVTRDGPRHGYAGGKTIPLRVTLLDPRTGAMSETAAPIIGAEGSEAFWKPMMEGVREIALRRGWPESAVMIGESHDARPTPEQAEVMRKWWPWARWNNLSHWSGDPHRPGPDGRIYSHPGRTEYGLVETIWDRGAVGPRLQVFDAETLAARSAYKYYASNIYRQAIDQASPPNAYRNVGWASGFSRLGLDFWPVTVPGTTNRRKLLQWRSSAARCMAGGAWVVTHPGADGALPSVRLQMLREALQEGEARHLICDAFATMPLPERAKRIPNYPGWVDKLLPQAQVSRDSLGGVAAVYDLAAELSGQKTEARWQEPPSLGAERKQQLAGK